MHMHIRMHTRTSEGAEQQEGAEACSMRGGASRLWARAVGEWSWRAQVGQSENWILARGLHAGKGCGRRSRCAAACWGKVWVLAAASPHVNWWV
eukprot:scaffold266746_cov23-Tisochrysis_lutea.AAC.1